MKRGTLGVVLAIFLATLLVRLLFASSIPNFTYDSYFHLRQVEHITTTGLPLYNDPLSYGGRQLVFLPLFHYLMAFFSLLLPLTFVATVLPNILMATLTIIVFFISKTMTDDDDASLMASLVAGFLPILFNTNSFTVQALFLPLVFLALYAFLHSHKKPFLYLYLITFILLSFTNSATFLIIMGFGLYLLLSFLEGKKVPKSEVEIILFSLFFYVWSQFLFFKQVFVVEGVNFIWQNVPSQIILSYFPKISILQAIVVVSIIPFLAGIYIVYRSLFHRRNQPTFLLISFVLSTTLLAWFQLIEFTLSLSLFGIILAILFGVFYHDFMAYLQKTKIYRFQRTVMIVTVLLLLVTMIPPVVQAAREQSTPTEEEIAAFTWLRNNTPADTGVLVSLEEGQLITYYAQRKNIMDDQFSLIPTVDQRFTDLNSLYSTAFETQAISLFNHYNINYVVITPHTAKKYSITVPKYYTSSCFRRVYRGATRIYRVACTLEKKE